MLLFIAACAVGCTIAFVIAFSAGRPRRMIFSIFLPAAVIGLWLLVLFTYSRLKDVPFSPDFLFPGFFYKAFWSWAFLPVSLFAGCLFGCFYAGGVKRFLKRISGSRPQRAAFGAFCAISLCVVVVCAVYTESSLTDSLRLTEACCANFSALVDPNTGEYEDYIELYNASEEAVRLHDYCLSDKKNSREVFRLPDVTLESGEYAVVWADGIGEDEDVQEGAISLGFSLKPGETVYLTTLRGVPVDFVTLPERYQNISINKTGDGWALAECTPGASGEGAAPFTPPTLSLPEANYPSGFYDSPIDIILTAGEECEIHYTLDGSLPDENDPVFDAPLTVSDRSDLPNEVVSVPNTTADRSGAVTTPVDKGTVLRAVAIGPDGARSRVFSAVYFVGESRFEKYKGCCVLNVIVDPDDLFGDKGIAVTGPEFDKWLDGGKQGKEPVANYNQRGREWERGAAIQYFDPSLTEVMDAECGIRVQGNYSRTVAVKRYTFYSREIYGGSDVFPYDIFENGPVHTFYTRSDVSDCIAHDLTSDLTLGGQGAVPAYVFINGELYNKTFLRERYDKQYFLSHYGVEKDDLVLVADEDIDFGTEKDLEDYFALKEYADRNDCSDPEVYEYLCSKMDVRNFASFMAAELYMNNTDWSPTLNYRLWRSRSGGGEGYLDGRWRWLMFDLDAIYWRLKPYGDAPRASYDIFHYTVRFKDYTYLEFPFFKDLLENADFRELFARTWLNMMNVTFNPERAAPILEKYWGSELNFWNELIEDRPKYAVDLLIDALELDASPCVLSLSVSEAGCGEIEADGFKLDVRDGTWSGVYVTGISPTLTAKAAPGWRFAGWTGDAEGTDPEIRVTLTGDTALTAVFERLP